MDDDGRIVRIREDDAPTADSKPERLLRAPLEAVDITPVQLGEIIDRREDSILGRSIEAGQRFERLLGPLDPPAHFASRRSRFTSSWDKVSPRA